MAYTKTPWTTGMSLTTARMNNLESQCGIAISEYNSHGHTDTFYTKSQMAANFYGTINDGPGSGIDADLIYSASGNQHAAAFNGMATPSGLIIMWFGDPASPPAGWTLCSSSPDLRGRMVVGTSEDYALGSTGGAATFTAGGYVTVTTHTLSINEIPNHAHTYLDAHLETGVRAIGDVWEAVYPRERAGPLYTTTTGGGQPHGHSNSIRFQAVASMPPYFALCFLKKN